MDSKTHKLTIRTPRLKEIQAPENEPFRKALIPLNGRLITADDPLIVGKNFRTLTNMRYGEQSPKSIGGMTKITTSVIDATYLKTRNAFQFRKVQPAETTTEETHVLAQVWNTGLTASKVFENTTAPPAQGNFSATAVWEDSSGAGVGRFSDAPNGMLAYCNGVDTCLWGGDGIPCTAFITSTADVTTVPTNPRDYSDAMLNTQQDGANVAVIGGGIDSCTVLMLHGDGVDASTTITDSASGGKAMTANGDAQIDASQAKFGTGSILFDGTGDYVSTPDHADFNFGTGTLTIEGWVRFNSLTGQHCLYSQASTTTYVTLYYDNTAHKLVFSVMSAGTRVIHESGSWTPSASTWYHVAVVRGWGGDADDWAITVDGTAIATFTNAGTLPDSGADLWIGLHPTTVLIDDGATGHGITAGGNAAISAAQYKFANGSLALDGNGWVQAEDPADFTLGSGDFCIEAFVRFTALPGAGSNMTLFAKGYLPANRYGWQVYVSNVGGTYYLGFGYSTNGAEATRVLTPREVTISTDTWYHFAVMRDGTNLTLWMDGAQLGAAADLTGVTIYDSSDILCVGAYYGPVSGVNGFMDEVRISNTARTVTVPAAPYTSDANTTLLLHCNYMGLNGWLDEYRVSKALARWTANFTPWARPYSSSALYWLIRSPLPLQGLKYYVSNGNLTTSTMTVKEWNGYSWQSLTISDGTASGGVSLAQTGTVSWSSTVDSSKPKYIDGNLGYWYLFSVNAGDAQIYYVALDAPCQAIKDIWSGIDLNLAAMFKYTTTYTDLTRTAREDYYDSADDTTYADLSSLSAFNAGNNCVIVGFSEQILAINIGVAPDATNSTAATSVAIDYWGGSGFIEVGNVVDGTSEGSISLAKSGTISWTPPDAGNVFKRTLSNNATPLYYYRIRFDKGLDASTRIYFVSGIQAPKAIRGYKFPLYSQDCLMLCCNMDGKRNSVLVSAPDTAQVFNGSESFEVEFGTEEEINCGCTIFSQYGSNLFNITMLFKDREIWNLVRGTDGWTKYRVSNSNGCPAPLTLDTVIIPPIEGRSQDNRCIAIWEDFDGVYISEGRHPTCVSDDIRDLWDQASTTKINLSYLGSHYGRVDQAKMEYRLFVATTAGSITTLDDEWVLDLRWWKWFHVDRTTGLKIQCAVSVKDAYGASYSYGFIDTGYMERLEYGNTFDGQNIVSTFQTGDFPLVEDDFLVENEIKALVPVMRAKETTTADATFTVYTDTYKTGTDYTADPTLSNYRLTMPVKGANTAPGVIHSIKGTMTTSNETTGFEPFVIGVYYQPVREHDYV